MNDKLRNHVVFLEDKLITLTARVDALESRAIDQSKRSLAYLKEVRDNNDRLGGKINEVILEVSRINGNVKKVGQAVAAASPIVSLFDFLTE